MAKVIFQNNESDYVTALLQIFTKGFPSGLHIKPTLPATAGKVTIWPPAASLAPGLHHHLTQDCRAGQAGSRRGAVPSAWTTRARIFAWLASQRVRLSSDQLMQEAFLRHPRKHELSRPILYSITFEDFYHWAKLPSTFVYTLI